MAYTIDLLPVMELSDAFVQPAVDSVQVAMFTDVALQFFQTGLTGAGKVDFFIEHSVEKDSAAFIDTGIAVSLASSDPTGIIVIPGSQLGAYLRVRVVNSQADPIVIRVVAGMKSVALLDQRKCSSCAG